jgi:mgtE-like transporter
LRAVAGRPVQRLSRTVRRAADPARVVTEYWRSERVTMRHGFTAVCLASLTSLIAGLTLSGMEGRIQAVKGLFVLIPVSIGMRGNIFGALSARLGTSIHMGLFEVGRDRGGVLMQNVFAATFLTMGTSVTIGLLSKAIAGLLGIETASVWTFIAVALAGGLLSSAVVMGATIFTSVTSHRRGWDLDSVGAPLITAIGDVVTLPCLFAASFLAELGWITEAFGIASLIGGFVALALGWTTALETTRRVVRESFPILCVAIVLDVLAGTVVQQRIETIFLAFTAYLIVIPGFLENTGALGSILAARLGSKLHLGAVEPRARPGAVALLDASIVMALGVTVYVITASTTLGVSLLVGADYPSALRFVGSVLLGGMLATLVASLIGYYAAIATYRFGFDPDNHTIPLVTSGMDLLGMICLVTSLVVFGVA